MHRAVILALSVGLAAVFAFVPSAHADDPEPTSEAGKKAAALLAEHGSALEDEKLESARAVRAKLAELFKAGKHLDEVRFRYARALREAADAYRIAKDEKPAVRASKALETLAEEAPKDDRVRGERIRDLWSQGRTRWNRGARDEALAVFQHARELVAADEAGPVTLDQWVWVLDGIHQRHDEDGEFGDALAVLAEMRGIVETKGATEVRSTEFLRSLVRQHERHEQRGEDAKADAVLNEIRTRAARPDGKPPRWQLARALRTGHRLSLPIGENSKAGALLEELRVLSADEAGRDARVEYISALATGAYNSDELLPFAEVERLVKEGRALLARKDIEDWDREQFTRLLRNASEQAAKQRKDDVLATWVEEGRALAFAEGATPDTLTQYGAQLMDAIRVYYRQGRYAEARGLLDASRTLTARENRTWQNLEQFTRNLVDVHLLAEHARSEDAARHRLELLAELEARSKDKDATPIVRVNLSQAYYNRHMYARRRGEDEAAGKAMADLRALIAEHPDEPRTRREMLDVLIREHEHAVERDLAAGMALLAEGRTLADREDAPAPHRARYLDMLTEQIDHVSRSREGKGLAELMGELRTRTARADLTEEERRWLVTGLRFLAFRTGKLRDRPRTDALVDEARSLARRPEATEYARSEFLRMLEIDARRLLEARELDKALAHLREIHDIAMRDASDAYQYERAAWSCVRFQDTVYRLRQADRATPARQMAEALFRRHPTNDDVVAAWIRMEGKRAHRLDGEDRFDESAAIRDALRKAADHLVANHRRPRWTLEELSVVLDREIYRLSRARPVDLKTMVVLVGEMRRRFDVAGASPAMLEELADSYLWIHGAYGDAERWAPARRTLDQLRDLVGRSSATEHQRQRLLDALEYEIWDIGTRETYDEVEGLADEARVIADAHPQEGKVQRSYARLLFVAHEILGETETHVPAAHKMLDRLRKHVTSREAVTDYEWDHLADALANATDYAQYDSGVAHALVVLAELRKLTEREGATEVQRAKLGYALAQLVDAMEWPLDGVRVAKHLDELDALASREDANDELRRERVNAYRAMAKALPGDADAGWTALLARTRKLSDRSEPTRQERGIHGVVLGVRGDKVDDPSAPAWALFGRWALRKGASETDHLMYAQALGRAAGRAEQRQDPEATLGFMKHFEKVAAASKKPAAMLEVFHEAKKGDG